MKTSRLFLLFVFVALSTSSFADWDVFKAGITTSSTVNPSGEYHHFVKIPGDPGYDFHHSSFGRFTSSDYFNVDSIRMWTYKNGGSNVCSSKINYRVYRSCDAPGAFNQTNLNWSCNGNCDGVGGNPGDQLWKYSGSSIDVLSGLTKSGTYIFEIYFEFTGSQSGGGCGDTTYLTNGSINNYRAYFEFENTDSFTDEDFTAPNWVSNDINNFTILKNSTVSSLTGIEPSYTHTVRTNSSYSGAGRDTSYIATQFNDWGGKQEWVFWVGRNGITASNTSQALIWLYADGAGLKTDTVSGYRLRMGDNTGHDEIFFEKVENGVVTQLGFSAQGVPNQLADYGIMFRVTCSTGGVWNVYSTPLPQNGGDTQSTPTAYGVDEGDITEHLIEDLVDSSSPIALNANGYFGFMTTYTSALESRQALEFDNFTFRPLPGDTYFTFSIPESSIDENAGSAIAIAVEIHNPSTTVGADVDVVLITGSASRTSPSYTTDNLAWAANTSGIKYINILPNDNDLCDDHAFLVFELQNPQGGNSAIVSEITEHTLMIRDDNMGYDTLLVQDFETSLPADWISTPANRWSRTNTNAVGSTGYSLGHNAFGVTDSSSIAKAIEMMPLVGLTTTWRFQVRYQGDGGIVNHWLTFLSANTTDLRNLSQVNGYAFGFNEKITGGTDDPLCLFKVTNGVYSVLINTGLDWVDDIGQNDVVSVEIVLDDEGEWSIRLDADGGFDNLVSYGTPTSDLTFPIMNAFGARVSFTNLSAERFRMDDISIEQKGCRRIWYSQTTGNSDAAVWDTQLSGTPTAVTSNRYDRFIVQSGNTITAKGLWVTDNISIESGGTLSGGTLSNMLMFGSWYNDGAFARGTSNVTFRGEEDQNILGSSITRFYDLTIHNNGGEVKVMPVDSIFIHNVARVDKGTFNLNGKTALFSNSVWSGSIGEIKDGASVIGKVTLMRYMPSIPNQYGNWINLGNPLTGLTLAAWNASIATTGYAGSNFPPPYSFVNIRSYDETISGPVNNGYQAATSSNNPMLSDRGYFVWLNGTVQNLRAKGEIQQGSITHSLNYTGGYDVTADGWNLMTNPYPSEVDWKLVSQNLVGPRAYYVFDYQINSYKYWLAQENQTGGVGTASRYIPHSQSFLVKVNTTGQYLEYEESFKSNNGTAFERSTGDLENSYIVLQLERNGMMDENMLFFSNESLLNLDVQDVLHLASLNENSIQMAMVSEDNYDLVQNTIPYNEEIVIPVRVKMPIAGIYNLIVPEIGNLPLGACLSITDLVTGQIQHLTAGMEMKISIQEPFEGIRFEIRGSAPAQVITTDATCFGQIDGSLDVTVPAMWAVKLSNDEDFEYISNGSVTMNGLRAGVYQLEIISQDESCGTQVKSYTINQPEQMKSAITTIEEVPCNSGNSGTFVVSVENAEWFNYEIMNDHQEIIQSANVDGSSVYAENLKAGVYTVNVYSECGAQSLNVDLNDHTMPNITVDAPQTVMLFHGETVDVMLNAHLLNTNQLTWTLSNGQTSTEESFEVNLTEAGVYTYTVSAKGINCDKTITGEFEVKLLSMDELTQASTITMTQQPEQLVLTFGATAPGTATVRVLDATGRIAMEQDLEISNGITLPIFTRQWSAGIYSVQVMQNNAVLYTEKVFRK